MLRSLTIGMAGLALSAGIGLADSPKAVTVPVSETLAPGQAFTGPAGNVPPNPLPTVSSIPEPSAAGSAGDPTRFWGGMEALGWWVRGQSLPALATTSAPGTPIGSAGVLGAPTTSVLYGNSRVNGDARFGGRFTLGTWLDDCHQWGIGGEFFILNQSGNTFFAASPGSPILTRPFTSFPAGTQNAQIVAFPGLAAGSLGANASNNLLGAGAFGLHTLCSGCDYRVVALAGYRYLRLEDRVGITEQLTATGILPAGVPAGTAFTVSDNFRTVNQFHGADLGLSGRMYSGPLFVDAMVRLGIGGTVRTLTADGVTVLGRPGQSPAPNSGGLLVPPGGLHHTDTAFSLVPDLRLNLGYRVSNNLEMFVGYNIFWWTNVIRAGEQISPLVNPAQLPPVTAAAPRPITPVSDTTIWVQGISFGILGRF